LLKRGEKLNRFELIIKRFLGGVSKAKLISSEIFGGTENFIERDKKILLRVMDFLALFMTLRVLSFLYLVWGFRFFFCFFLESFDHYLFRLQLHKLI
jgi:hypothetical protein